MARDVPPNEAEVLLEGTTTRGKKITRWLDGPPSPGDLRGLRSVNIQLMRVIRRKAIEGNQYD